MKYMNNRVAILSDSLGNDTVIIVNEWVLLKRK